jgi:flagellar motor switch protein FliM
MPKEGLIALAESYGLERAELHQLKILAESFFDKLREDLLSYVGRSLRIADLTQTTATFAEFSTDPVASCHLVFIGFGNQILGVMRLDHDLARALIDCMLGGANVNPGAERKMTTVEERIIANTVGAAIVKTTQRVLGPLLQDDGINLRLMRIEHRPVIVPDTLAPSEQMVTARVRCDAGAAGGWIEVGLPFSFILKIRSTLTPARPRSASAIGAEDKARTLLADASLELSAILGTLSFPLSGVRALAPGSLLMLQKTQRGFPSIELRSGDQPLFTGTIVEQDGWYRFLIDKTGGTDERANPDGSDA